MYWMPKKFLRKPVKKIVIPLGIFSVVRQRLFSMRYLLFLSLLISFLLIGCFISDEEQLPYLNPICKDLFSTEDSVRGVKPDNSGYIHEHTPEEAQHTKNKRAFLSLALSPTIAAQCTAKISILPMETMIEEKGFTVRSFLLSPDGETVILHDNTGIWTFDLKSKERVEVAKSFEFYLFWPHFWIDQSNLMLINDSRRDKVTAWSLDIRIGITETFEVRWEFNTNFENDALYTGWQAADLSSTSDSQVCEAYKAGAFQVVTARDGNLLIRGDELTAFAQKIRRWQYGETLYFAETETLKRSTPNPRFTLAGEITPGGNHIMSMYEWGPWQHALILEDARSWLIYTSNILIFTNTESYLNGVPRIDNPMVLYRGSQPVWINSHPQFEVVQQSCGESNLEDPHYVLYKKATIDQAEQAMGVIPYPTPDGVTTMVWSPDMKYIYIFQAANKNYRIDRISLDQAE